MKNKIGISLMITGCLAIIAAVFLVGLNIGTNYSSGKKSGEVLSLLESEIESNENENFIYNENKTDKSLKSISVGDNTFIGIINIPDIGIELPVMSSWNYDNLDISPCLYYRDSEKMVIAAHNFSTHFGKIKELSYGDYITFRDTENNIQMYEVVNTEILDSYDTKKMISGEDWDLTLFTCTLSGTQRVTVRCKEISDFKKS